MRLPVLLGVTCLAASCASAFATRTPEPTGFLAQYYRRNLNSPDALPLCRTKPLALGKTVQATIKRLKLRLFLPDGFVVGPLNTVIERNIEDERGIRPEGQEWLTGIYLAPVEFYRWSRIQTTPDQPLVDAPASVVQLDRGAGYSVFAVGEGWRIRASEECAFQLDGRTARVLRFSLDHPTKPTQWGLAAYWIGRPDDGWISFLAIGPDDASQAEFLGILKAHQP